MQLRHERATVCANGSKRSRNLGYFRRFNLATETGFPTRRVGNYVDAARVAGFDVYLIKPPEVDKLQRLLASGRQKPDN